MGLFIFVSSSVQKLEPKKTRLLGTSQKIGVSVGKWKIQKIQKSTSPTIQWQQDYDLSTPSIGMYAYVLPSFYRIVILYVLS
jgi:hypothetical protein